MQRIHRCTALTRQQRLRLSLLLLLLLACLSSCSQAPRQSGHNMTLAQSLQTRGVSLEKIGNTITLTLPSSALFQPASENFNKNSATLLQTLAAELKPYVIETMQITGFAGKPHSAWSRALAAKRAQQVKSYLWQHAIKARFAIAKGQYQSDRQHEIQLLLHYVAISQKSIN